MKNYPYEIYLAMGT